MSIPNANVELLQCSLWVLVNLWQMISLEDTISGVAPTMVFHPVMVTQSCFLLYSSAA